jgi:hypothetical protein
LKDALNHFRDRYELPILVNTEAFKNDLQLPEVEAQQVQLPKITGIRLGVVLDRLAAQVGGRYLVRADHVEITTAARVKDAVWGLMEPTEEISGGRQRPLLALVHATLDRRPLAEALEELRKQSGTTIIVDERRAGDQARAIVTAGLNNVPLDTAVSLLADQAGLEAVLLDNAFYVTTPEQAKALRQEQRKANQRGMMELPSVGQSAEAAK